MVNIDFCMKNFFAEGRGLFGACNRDKQTDQQLLDTRNAFLILYGHLHPASEKRITMTGLEATTRRGR